MLLLWLLHGKTVRSEDTGDILFFDVVDAAAADLVVADSEEAGEKKRLEEACVVIFHPLLPPPGSKSWKASHSSKAITVQTKSP